MRQDRRQTSSAANCLDPHTCACCLNDAKNSTTAGQLLCRLVGQLLCRLTSKTRDSSARLGFEPRAHDEGKRAAKQCFTSRAFGLVDYDPVDHVPVDHVPVDYVPVDFVPPFCISAPESAPSIRPRRNAEERRGGRLDRSPQHSPAVLYFKTLTVRQLHSADSESIVRRPRTPFLEQNPLHNKRFTKQRRLASRAPLL